MQNVPQNKFNIYIHYFFSLPPFWISVTQPLPCALFWFWAACSGTLDPPTLNTKSYGLFRRYLSPKVKPNWFYNGVMQMWVHPRNLVQLTKQEYTQFVYPKKKCRLVSVYNSHIYDTQGSTAHNDLRKIRDLSAMYKEECG